MPKYNDITIGIYGIKDVNNLTHSTISHDHGIAIIENGKITHNLELERVDRCKHSSNMEDYIYNLLKEKKILNKDINIVFVDNILGRAFVNNSGNIRFEAPLIRKLREKIETGRIWWLNTNKKAFILNHELAHIGSCLPFFGHFKENSLLIHFDGGASMSNFSAWVFKNNKLQNVEYSWKLKWLSSLFNANALTFAIVNAKPKDLNSVPGKFMGFASYGRYNEDIEQWLIDNDFFNNIWGNKSLFFKSLKEKFNVNLSFFNQKDSFIQDIAKTIHHIFVRDSFKEFVRLQKTTNTDYLYYSGGSALNIVLNTKILNSNIFKEVFIPPCCNDSGLAIGAASFFEWSLKNKIDIHSPFLNNWNIEDYKCNYTKDTIRKISDFLANKKTVGVINGYAEVGPRALGNRSIICLASSKELANTVSMKLKKREWYRPVAPIMLEKNTKYFTGLNNINHLSKFMLLDFKILKNRRNELEGAVHSNGNARIQTIFNRQQNPFIYDLLSYLDDCFGIKALINTSFNTRGEPIVHTHNDAVKSAMSMGINILVSNGKIIELN
jgi:carbamoyltransferase